MQLEVFNVCLSKAKQIILSLKLKYLHFLYRNTNRYNIGYILSLLPKDQIIRKAGKSKKRKGKWIKFRNKKVRCYSKKYFFYLQEYYNNKYIQCPICHLRAEYFKMLPSGNVDLFNTDYTFNLFAEKDGKQIMFDIDHIKPVSKGGKNTKQNLQILCHHCNNNKADKIQTV